MFKILLSIALVFGIASVAWADCPCIKGDINPAPANMIMQAEVDGVVDPVNYAVPEGSTAVYYELSAIDGGNKTFRMRVGLPWPGLPDGTYRFSDWSSPFEYALPDQWPYPGGLTVVPTR